MPPIVAKLFIDFALPAILAIAREVISNRGRVARNLEISPGRRTIRLQVAWDDDVRTEEIEGAFNAGTRLNLRARLGSIGGLRKHLSLDWN